MGFPVCLSANGEVVTSGPVPADRLLVATVDGLVLLERQGQGQLWRTTSRSLRGAHPSSLVVEPRSGRIFCGLHYSGGVVVSEDGGLNWTKQSQGLESGHIYMLAAQQVGDRTVLYTGTEPPMLYRSDDLGESWQSLPGMWDVPDTDQWRFPPPPHVAHVKNIAAHPAEPETLYICVEQGDLLKSTDGGESWRSLTSYESPQDQFRRDMHRVVIKPSNPRKLYLATGVGLYYSEDGGESFDHISPGNARVGYPDCLFLDPKNENTVYMAGASRAPNPSWKALHSAQPGILRSIDGGRNWQELTVGLPAMISGNVEAMCAHQSPQGLSLFAGTTVGEIWGSDDGGDSWTLVANNLAPISKGAHYRHFVSPEQRQQIEDALRANAA